MSIDYYFYLESRAGGAWDVPGAFTPPDAPDYRRVDSFASIRGSSGLRRLFLGDRAPIPFRAGHPPAWESSALYRWMRPELWAGDPDRPAVSWIPYAELMVELWDETSITVGASVPARLAALFGDGVRPFPEAALLAAGMDAHSVSRLREGRPAPAPVDRTFGQARHETEAHHPHHPLEVTWRATIVDYLGREVADAFRSLRRFGEEAELRVVAVYA